MIGTRMVALGSGCVLALAACGGSSGGERRQRTDGDRGTRRPRRASRRPTSRRSTSSGPRGALNIVAWAGYAEDGSNDPTVDWVTPFEKATGCKVNVKTAPTSDDMVNLMKTGQYDVVSASGDASLRLIASGDVEPVNTDLVPNYADVFAGLKMKPWNSVDGVAYGIPHGRGANLLMYNTDVVKPGADLVGRGVRRGSPYKGKVTAYDSPIYIADAALYLMKTKPELGHQEPLRPGREAVQRRGRPAQDAERRTSASTGRTTSRRSRRSTTGDTVLGTTWQIIANYVEADKKVKVKAILPSEGATGWSDTWMVATKSQAPDLRLQVDGLDHQPEGERRGGRVVRRGAGQQQVLRRDGDKTFCDTFHADDEAYFDQVWYWNTPIAQCLDGRTDVQCKDYGEWTQAWQEIKG